MYTRLPSKAMISILLLPLLLFCSLLCSFLQWSISVRFSGVNFPAKQERDYGVFREYVLLTPDHNYPRLAEFTTQLQTPAAGHHLYHHGNRSGGYDRTL